MHIILTNEIERPIFESHIVNAGLEGLTYRKRRLREFNRSQIWEMRQFCSKLTSNKTLFTHDVEAQLHNQEALVSLGILNFNKDNWNQGERRWHRLWSQGQMVFSSRFKGTTEVKSLSQNATIIQQKWWRVASSASRGETSDQKATKHDDMAASRPMNGKWAGVIGGPAPFFAW